MRVSSETISTGKKKHLSITYNLKYITILASSREVQIKMNEKVLELVNLLFSEEMHAMLYVPAELTSQLGVRHFVGLKFTCE